MPAMRRLVVALVVLLAVYFGLSRLAEVQQVAETMQRGNALWLGLALVAQWAWLANNALTLRAVYRLLGLEASLRQLLPLAISSNFLNVVAPSGGMGGMALFVSDARERRLSRARVTLAGVLFVLFDYFAFLCVLALGWVVLLRRNNLTAVEVAASLLLLAAALSLAGLLVLGASAPPAFERVLRWAARAVNRLAWPLMRRPYLSEARAQEFAAEAAEGLQALRTDWQGYVPPAVLALLGKGQLILILLLVFLAFGVPFSAGTLVGGYSIGQLFTMVSPTPGGIGVVEGTMALGLVSLRVPVRAATIITLAYRGLTFWLPLAYGFVGLRVVQQQWAASRSERVS
jgi:uncharacterized protein (TIRG00374 family)